MRAFLVGLVLVAASVAGACQGNVFALKVGDCFNGGDSDTVTDVATVPCTDPHEKEVFATPSFTDGATAPYPGSTAVSDFADAQCRAAFQPYVGHDYDSSELYLQYLSPTEESWGSGDRIVDCILHLLDNEKLTGSMKNSNR